MSREGPCGTQGAAEHLQANETLLLPMLLSWHSLLLRKESAGGAGSYSAPLFQGLCPSLPVGWHVPLLFSSPSLAAFIKMDITGE